jgi:hypothetical protein
MRSFPLLMLSAFLWSAAALAQNASGPVISQSPIAADPSRSTTGEAPLDLPAPETRSWVNRPLLVTGTIVLVGSYVPAAIVAYTSDRPSDQTNLYYPVVGPWMDLADRDCANRPCSNGDAVGKVLLIAGGVGQGLGALAVVSSFFLPNKVTRNWYLVGNDHTHVAPSRIGSGYGLSAAGSF